jgi:CheY-like chemotaxis protein
MSAAPKLNEMPKLLVVDDDEDIRDIIIENLELSGFEAITAESGQQALSLLESQHVDLVLSDIKMPNGSGIDLLNGIKANNLHLPVILIISDYSELSDADVYDLGVEAILTKPINFNLLEQKINKLTTPATKRWERLHQRFEYSSEVEIKQSQDLETIEGSTVNLGRGGLFVEINNQAPLPSIGQLVRFKISPTEITPQTISGLGRVRWARKHNKDNQEKRGIGVEFECFDHGSLELFNKMLVNLKTKAYIPKSL